MERSSGSLLERSPNSRFDAENAVELPRFQLCSARHRACRHLMTRVISTRLNSQLRSYRIPSGKDSEALILTQRPASVQSAPPPPSTHRSELTISSPAG